MVAQKVRALGTMASDVTPERLDMLSPGRLALGKVTMLDGDPGLGKSTLSLDWAARISTGRALPGGDPRPPKGVVILSAEDAPADTIVPRLIAADADLSRVFIMDGMEVGGQEADLTLPGGVQAIATAIADYDAALLIVDPLVAYLGGDVNASRDQDIRRALKAMAATLDDAKCAGLFLRHLNKATGVQPMYRGGGSIAIIGAARFGLLVAPDPDDDSACIVASTKSNLGPKSPALRYRLESVLDSDVARMVWDSAPIHVTAERLLTKEQDLPAKQRQIVDLLVERGGMTPVEIADALGKDRSTVRTQLMTMLKNGRIEKREDRYSAPKQTQQAQQDGQSGQDGQPLPLSTLTILSSTSSVSTPDQPTSLWTRLPVPLPVIESPDVERDDIAQEWGRTESNVVPPDCGQPHNCTKLGVCRFYGDSGCPLGSPQLQAVS